MVRLSNLALYSNIAHVDLLTLERLYLASIVYLGYEVAKSSTL